MKTLNRRNSNHETRELREIDQETSSVDKKPRQQRQLRRLAPASFTDHMSTDASSRAWIEQLRSKAHQEFETFAKKSILWAPLKKAASIGDKFAENLWCPSTELARLLTAICCKSSNQKLLIHPWNTAELASIYKTGEQDDPASYGRKSILSHGGEGVDFATAVMMYKEYKTIPNNLGSSLAWAPIRPYWVSLAAKEDWNIPQHLTEWVRTTMYQHTYS